MTKCDKIFVPGNHSWSCPIFVGKPTAYPRGTPYCAHQRDSSVQRERETARAFHAQDNLHGLNISKRLSVINEKHIIILQLV